MSEEAKRFHRSVQSALRNEPPVWTPQCPEPETLLDWVEQASAYPQAARLLDHLTACAHCRQAYTQMCEIRAASRAPVTLSRVSDRLGRLEAWVGELLTAGIATPVGSIQTALRAMDRLTALSAPAPARGVNAPSALNPAWTAVRTPNPTLRWSADHPAQEYVVLVTRHTGRKARQPAWEGSAGAERHLTLPAQAGLEAGRLYLWQVVARTAGQEEVCPPVCFAILSDPARRQLETLEAETGEETLERIALLEAFGLYDEALQQIETMAGLHPEDTLLPGVRAKLLERQPA